MNEFEVLDVGAGPKNTNSGTLKFDINKNAEPDVVGDAVILPFKDESFEQVIASQILEHLSDPLDALLEFERVLKPEGSIEIRVPHARSLGQLSDPTHKSYFTSVTWKYIDPNYEVPGISVEKPQYYSSKLSVQEFEFYSLDTPFLPQKLTSAFCYLFTKFPYVYEFFYWFFPIDTRMYVRLSKDD